MPLGTEDDLGPDHIVLDGDPAAPVQKGHSGPPLFGPRLLWPNVSPSCALAHYLLTHNKYCKLFPVCADDFVDILWLKLIING